MTSTPRGKHSHRCKICRSGVYCYQSGCLEPQRIDACAECRRTGRYVAPIVARETAPAVVVSHAAPALKGWLAGLPDATREAVYAVMRDMDTKAERANARHMELRPRYGEIAVGGAHMDPFFEYEGLRAMLRDLHDGGTPLHACVVGNEAANYAIGRWNASREWQVHRAKDSERTALEYQCSRLQLVVQKGAA